MCPERDVTYVSGRSNQPRSLARSDVVKIATSRGTFAADLCTAAPSVGSRVMLVTCNGCFEIDDYSRSFLDETGAPPESRALASRLDKPTLGYLGAGDRILLQDSRRTPSSRSI
jgi:hypothetical protein